MIPEETIDAWFSYQPQTSDSTKKLDAIQGGILLTRKEINKTLHALFTAEGLALYDHVDSVNDALKSFAITVNENAPDSADKSASMRCLRLCRSAANQAIFRHEDVHAYVRYMKLVWFFLEQAHWQANQAIFQE